MRIFFKKNPLTFFLALLFPLVLFSCASNQTDGFTIPENQSEILYVPAESEIKWQKIENLGWAEYFFYENKEIPVRYHAVKIDLSSGNLEILTFPESESDFIHKNGKNTGSFTGLHARQFSQKYDSVVTINATPYTGKNENWDISAKLSSTRKILGIHSVNKKQLSPPLAKYSAICFKKTESGFTGKIFKTQSDGDFSEYDFAFGGFFTILSDGQKEKFAYESRDSRSAVGLSEDGKTLYLLVVEGEKHSKSAGLSYPECADVFLALGAKNAMQLDGGGSSSLFINGKNALSYKTRRKNAVFIGFK